MFVVVERDSGAVPSPTTRRITIRAMTEKKARSAFIPIFAIVAILILGAVIVPLTVVPLRDCHCTTIQHFGMTDEDFERWVRRSVHVLSAAPLVDHRSCFPQPSAN